MPLVIGSSRVQYGILDLEASPCKWPVAVVLPDKGIREGDSIQVRGTWWSSEFWVKKRGQDVWKRLWPAPELV